MRLYLSTHTLDLVFQNPSRQVFGGFGWSLVGPRVSDYVATLREAQEPLEYPPSSRGRYGLSGTGLTLQTTLDV